MNAFSLLFRMSGEEAEIRFCEQKRLNMATLRMTWEAKVQLKEILINSGFPEGIYKLVIVSHVGNSRSRGLKAE